VELCLEVVQKELAEGVLLDKLVVVEKCLEGVLDND
jgi:hypothetical protein